MQRFLAELKRRKVLRVAGAYAVVAWGALQVAEKLFPALLLPHWTITFVAVLLLIGLPITVIITWAFEITPDGIRLTPATSPAEPQPGRGGWLEAALLLAIVAAVGISAVQLARRETSTAKAPEVPAADPAIPAVPAAAAPAEVGEAIVANSIAVLPFTSFSDDPESNYFADGLTEELINALAQVRELKVTGRTSSFFFKNRNEDLREIGRQLGVAHVLEGSVRRSGGQLRITAQLVSTADGFHLWSQTYDRRLDDIFAIQDDVAENVAATLETRLVVRHADSRGTARDGEHHRRYLIARALLHERGLDPLTQARALFGELRESDPDDVDALAGYTEATMLLAGTYMTLDFDPAAEDAIATIEHALSIDPDSVSANVAAGAAYTVFLHRTEETRYRVLAERHLARAVELAPRDPDALAAYGTLLNELGRHDSAHELLSRAVTRDPLSRLAQAQLIIALEGLGRLADARERLLTLMQMYPDYVFAQLELGELLLNQGQLDAALPYLRKAHATRTSPRATFVLASACINLGLDDELGTVLDELGYAPLSAPFAQVIRMNSRGDDAGAFRLAEAQLESTNDPIWHSLLIHAALRLSDLETARRELEAFEPALLTSFDASGIQPEAALFGAELLLREGRTREAAQLLESLLARHEPPGQGYDPVEDKLIRAKALGFLGRDDAALEELRAAYLQGYRLLWDFDYFQRLDGTAAFAALRDDPRFRAIIAGIEADNRAMRERAITASGAAQSR